MSLATHPIRRRIPIAFGPNRAEPATDIACAMATARSAQTRWSRTSIDDRLKMIRRLRGLIAAHAIALAKTSASPRSRPIVEALTAEVLPLAEACRYLEREAKIILRPKRLNRRDTPLWLAGVRSEIHREPLGVVLIIGPGNYPLLLPGVQIIQALTAGNAVLIKPGAGGTDAMRLLSELILRAGADPDLIMLLPETTTAAEAAIATRPDKVLFTGSAATGEKILNQLAPHLIPATMELSGCDAVIVRDDANLDLVVKALRFGLTLNNGATCLSPKRVFVSVARTTELEGRLARAFCTEPGAQKPLPCGEKIWAVVQETLASGAHVIAGEIREDNSLLFPIILGGVSPSTQLLREDIFAAILSIVTVADDDEAVHCANDCPFALGASIFTQDQSAARHLAAQLNVGTVSINDLIVPTADARLPFGGRHRSGFGVTRGAEGLLELTAPKVITLSRGKFRPAFEAPQPGDEKLFDAYIRLTHGTGWRNRIRALGELFRQTIARRKLRTNL